VESREALDLTGDARETLHEWMADKEGGFDEDEAASELAWSFVNDLDDDDSASTGEPSNFEDRWAKTLLDRLVRDKAIEIKSGAPLPIEWVAHWLAWKDDDQIASRVFAALMDSPYVEEVYIDDTTELAEVIRECRPQS